MAIILAHAGTTTESRIMSPEAVSYTRHWNCSKISAGKQPAEAWDHKGLLVRKWGRSWCWNKLLNPFQAQKEHGEKAQKITLDFVIYIFFFTRQFSAHKCHWLWSLYGKGEDFKKVFYSHYSCKQRVPWNILWSNNLSCMMCFAFKNVFMFC